MSTEPEFPGTIVRGQGFVEVPVAGTPGGHLVGSIITVTTPAVSVADLIRFAVEGLVTSTPRTAPEPPGVTRAEWPCCAIATWGYVPLFNVTCAKRHSPN